MTGPTPEPEDLAGFALPPFKAAEALLGMKRQWRDWKLSEQNAGQRFALAGRAILEVITVEPAAIGLRLVKRPAMTPEWIPQTLKSSAEVRKFQQQLQQQLARWADAD